MCAFLEPAELMLVTMEQVCQDVSPTQNWLKIGLDPTSKIAHFPDALI